MDPLDIVVVSFVLAYDGIPISSTRIRKGEINKNGEIVR
jgi:pantetheine-phosphate adenylyltransferase